MIDVHCAAMPGEVVPANPKSDVISVHHITAVPNKLVTRRLGFLEGHHPFVSFYDPDDKVLGDPFSECLNVLLDHPHYGIVYTNSILDDGSKMYPSGHRWSIEHHMSRAAPIHQVAVMRRSLVEDALDHIWSDPKLVAALHHSLEMHCIYAYIVRRAPAKILDTVVGYQYNKDSGNKTRKGMTPDQRKYAKGYIRNQIIGDRYEIPYLNDSRR